MVEGLSPSVVLVFGDAKARVFAQLSTRTEFITFAPPTVSMRAPRRVVPPAGKESMCEAA